MALIKEVEVEFGRGLNIMTGETGAGKSIVIGAVNIALGTGNFRDYVPEDADYALVELVFVTDNPAVRRKMLAQELPFEDGEVIITRRYRGRPFLQQDQRGDSIGFFCAGACNRADRYSRTA